MKNGKKLEELARKVQQLPTLPTVYFRVTELMNDPNSSAAEIGEVVAHDQAIAARLLRVINSSFYGFKERISSVTCAMTMIGFRGLRELILTLTALPILRRGGNDKAFDDRTFWAHAVGCAAGARSAARLLRVGDPEEAFTAGLLHDIGKLAEYWFLKEEFVALLERAHDENEPIFVLERDSFGFTHADLGRMLAEKWQFPDRLVDVISNHHTPAGSTRFPREAAIIHLADIISRAKMLGDTYDGRVPPLDMNAWQVIGLEKNQIEHLMQIVDEEFEKGKAFLSVMRSV